MENIMKLADTIRETSFAIHTYFRYGHLEKVYENSLVHRLRKLGIEVKQQCPVKVYEEDGTIVGDFVADLFVDNRMIVELKAVRTFNDEHVAQILCYMRGSRIEHGLLINFGSSRMQIKSIFSPPDVFVATKEHKFFSFVNFVTLRGKQNECCVYCS